MTRKEHFVTMSQRLLVITGASGSGVGYTTYDIERTTRYHKFMIAYLLLANFKYRNVTMRRYAEVLNLNDWRFPH